ncbi:L-aminoadipate-semialdehyde dehydrogenase-phosphopantetheinyl transferase-like [Vespa mandarinia]|uniref:L-aminoadipate-semialdehyde dehydrogenase-phosphopantetheinyl transferase-like n=1 Tax=Vespa mandarinia TaxID=7446 RepID=UPI00160B6BCD|nr:L-aminoadipate-semialdehyde dehydrogenase-phosphopantetheinyl transferase-like [Vespa mandarinia]
MKRYNIIIDKMSQSVRWAFNWKEWNPSEKEFSHAISCVQLEEKERLDRFVFRKDVRASLIGRLLMRKFVNDYTNIPYDKILFTRDNNNKPILKNSPINISFNVSHQGYYSVLAGEIRDVLLGVDIMKLEYTGGKRLSEFFRIMNRNFSSSEWDEIRGTPTCLEVEQISMFCRHWALKESFVKALGIGIVTDLRTIDFKTNSKLVPNKLVCDTVLYQKGNKQNWLFEESLLDSEHCVAVALQENGIAPKSQNKMFELLDYNKLLVNAIPMHSEDEQYVKKYFSKNEKP